MALQSPSIPPLEVGVRGEFPAILSALGVTLAVASYHAGALVLVSPDEAGGVVVLPRAFDKPMTLSAQGKRLVVATRNDLVHFAASTALAPGLARARDTYRQLWLPRAVNFTGEIDLHDITCHGDEVLGVATRFSCLARLDATASFAPVWQPPFITALAPEDRCHLNGMAIDTRGAPRFVTMLGATNATEGWRSGRVGGGVLMSVPEGRVVLSGLCMPHSPRLVGEDLMLLNSGAGEVLRLPAGGGTAEVVARLPGFARGFVVRGDLMFIGLSRLRDRHGAGREMLPVEASGAPLSCGVAVLDRRTGRLLGELLLSGSVNEVADIALLDGAGRHGLLSHTDPLHRDALALPDQGFWAAPNDMAA
jgi:uncharacterized protein (TIGR03032 family)